MSRTYEFYGIKPVMPQKQCAVNIEKHSVEEGSLSLNGLKIKTVRSSLVIVIIIRVLDERRYFLRRNYSPECVHNFAAVNVTHVQMTMMTLYYVKKRQVIGKGVTRSFEGHNRKLFLTLSQYNLLCASTYTLLNSGPKLNFVFKMEHLIIKQ